MGAAAIPIFMISSAALAAESANRQNRAARRTAESARISAQRKSEFLESRQAIVARGIARKSDQQRLQVARESAMERGARIANAASRGVSAFSGSDARNLIDLGFRRDALQKQISENFAIDMQTLQSQTQSGIIDNDAALRRTLAQADAMQQNEIFSAFAGGMQGFATGLNVQQGMKA